jgi:hypothetical protein
MDDAKMAAIAAFFTSFPSLNSIRAPDKHAASVEIADSDNCLSIINQGVESAVLIPATVRAAKVVSVFCFVSMSFRS